MTKNLNKHQKLATEQIKNAINWEVGGWYNCVQDAELEWLPKSVEACYDAIYDGVMNETYGVGMCGGYKTSEIRFAGKKFIAETIVERLLNNEDMGEIANIKGWDLRKELKKILNRELGIEETEETTEAVEEVKVERKHRITLDDIDWSQRDIDWNIMKYVPMGKRRGVVECYKDPDGYWIYLDDGWNADRMDYDCHTIHEWKIEDLRYQIAGIRKIK